jgi:protein involved in polysaccharide export with SLBB domain
MIKKLVTLLSAFFVIFTVNASVTLQQSETAENQLSIYEPEKSTSTRPIITSDLYGDWLFHGGFKQTSFSAVNPNYLISQGDNLLIQLWGGIDYQAEIKVDPQGNVYIPKVGPIKVLGVANEQLNKVVLQSIKRVYKANVKAYVSLLSSQKVKVFLSGLVNVPGIYEGQSADSILRFIDLAGGIRKDIGSYRNIQVKRNNQIKNNIDLYKFLQKGDMPVIQLQDGDVIFVGSSKGQVSIEGDVGFEGRYELKDNKESLEDILAAVVNKEKATHVTIIEPSVRTLSKGSESKIAVQQYPINNIADVIIKGGAVIKVSSQLRANSISIELMGEHNSAFELVVPWGSSLNDVLAQIEFTKLSNKKAIQLFRPSVGERQKDMLQASLTALEQSVLTARSNTNEAAQLRATEASTILQWIEKAKKVIPKGQVILSEGYNANEIILQQGDRVVVPIKRNLIMVHGEVLFPTAIAYENNMNVEDFIAQSGGVLSDIDDLNILIMKPNGSFIDVNDELTNKKKISPGDEIFVLAKPDAKSFQLTKDLTQIMYQIAVSAAVILAL